MAGSVSANRRPDIQGLRAIAVLMVVAYHAAIPLPGGFAGVDVFFVISGFVITAMLMRERETTGGIRLGRFYVRRFQRLTPALAVMVLATLILSIAFLSPIQVQSATFQTAIGALLLYANYAIARYTGGYFDVAAESNPLLHTWTLSLEEQFYLIFPALLILGWWISVRSGRTRVVLGFVGAFGLASFAVAIVVSGGGNIPMVPDGFVGFYGPLGRAWEFAAGAVIALALSRLRPLGNAAGLVLSAIGCAALLATMLLLSEDYVFPGVASLLPVIGTGLLLYGGTAQNVIRTLLSSRPLVAIGDLSYSWYLWHWPVIVIATQLLPDAPLVGIAAAAASLIPAYASYRWVESRFRKPALSRRRLFGLVAAFLVPPLAASGFALASSADGYGIPGVQDAQAAQGPHAGFLAGCMSFDPVDEESAADCMWNASSAGKPVYLVGDSIADHYSEGLIAAGEAVGRSVTVTVAAGCPIYQIVLPHDGEAIDVTAEARCESYQRSLQTWLLDQPPGLVIIGETDSSWWEPSPAIPADTEPFDVPDDVKAQAIESSLHAVVDHLQSHGHTVVLAMAPPSYRWPRPSWDPSKCSFWELAARSCQATRTVEDLDVLQGPMRGIIRRIANDTGAGVLDLRDHFCAHGVCSTSRNGHMVYLDAIHISVAESLALTPRFVELLESY